MGKLIYLITTSLDGYAADKNGKFDWAMPSEEVHSFVNDSLRDVGTILMGSKLYETMKVWDDIPTEGVSGPYMDGPSQSMNDFAKIWKSANATIEKSFDPNAVQKMVADSDKDVDIGGPHLAAAAIKANIIDEYHQIIVPLILGGGNHWLPGGNNNKLELTDMRKFKNGFVHLQYRKA
jgi:dihydrofolate reductase